MFIVLLILFVACNSGPKKEKRANFIEGKWIVQYPDHDRMDQDLKERYGKIQDSIVTLMGLKLIRFEEDGRFYQADSSNHAGQWEINDGKVKNLIVEKGGAGFSPFKAALLKDEDSLVILTESVKYKGNTFEIDWNLKRLSDDDAAFFFAKANNKWRIRPSRVESPKELKEKLQAMLEYYSVYYSLVDKEANYFIPSRILMPFKFYQHAMGLEPLDADSNFQKFFFNDAQAKEAYGYLETAMDRLSESYPSYQYNYVKEYAAFMKLMSEEMSKMNE